jgi:hypothetical protein
MYYLPTNYDISSGTLTSSFNPADFHEALNPVSNGDLRNYANLFQTNLFTKSNYFVDIFVSSINALSSDTINYLVNITEPVQDALTYLRFVTTNISYDPDNQITKVEQSLYADRVTSSTLNCEKMATISVQSQAVTANKIICRTIQAKEIVCDTIKVRDGYTIGAFIYLNNCRTVPILKSGTVTTAMKWLRGIDSMDCEITLLPFYKLTFLDQVGNLLYVVDNSNSDDVLYSVVLYLPRLPYKFALYYRGKIII